MHINLLEMKALFLALQAFQEVVSGHHVTAMCDNSTVVAYVNKQGGTVSRPLCVLTSRLLRWAESFDVHLEARYLPGESNVPGRCTQPSRASCRDRVVSPPSGGAIRRSICSRLASTRSCPYIARLSRIHRPSSRMRFVILGTAWIFTRSLPLLWSVG